jgi:hypothetical protein
MEVKLKIKKYLINAVTDTDPNKARSSLPGDFYHRLLYSQACVSTSGIHKPFTRSSDFATYFLFLF